MLPRRLLLTTSAAFALLYVQGIDQAQAQILVGTVSSREQGKMEGVLVSAKKVGGTVTTTVVTNEKGEYSFPTARLEPGSYRLAIRAVGYELDGKEVAATVGGTPTSADLELRKARDVSQQLSNAEWMMSVPGSEQQRKFLADCVTCHSVQRIVRSVHDSGEFMQIFRRMASYTPGSMPTHSALATRTIESSSRGFGSEERMQAAANWLETINLSRTTTWEYPFKPIPRPTGKATRVVITEYDLPRRDAQPHDVILNSDGYAWYSDFGQQYVGYVDPKTGKATDIQLPLIKPGKSTGSLDLEADRDGNLWVAGMYQTGLFEIDKGTHKVTHFPLPAQWQSDRAQQSMVSPNYAHVDGLVWTNNQGTREHYRLDPKTATWTSLQMKDETGKLANAYGMPVDPQNGLFLLDFGGQSIGHYHADSRKVTVHPTPSPSSRPRRGHVAEDGKVWFAEYGGDAIAMYDDKVGAIKEWRMPTPFSAPYDAVANNNGDEAWAGSMLTDMVSRLDVKSGTYTEYMLPRTTNIRRVFIDSNTQPNTLWIGNNHGASIIKVEPLE